MLKTEEDERLDFLIKLTLENLIIAEALTGEEDSYSLQISRGPL